MPKNFFLFCSIMILAMSFGCSKSPSSTDEVTADASADGSPAAASDETDSEADGTTDERTASNRPRLTTAVTTGLPECDADSDCPTGKVCDLNTFHCITPPPTPLQCASEEFEIGEFKIYSDERELLAPEQLSEGEDRIEWFGLRVHGLADVTEAYLVGPYPEQIGGGPERFFPDQDYQTEMVNTTGTWEECDPTAAVGAAGYCWLNANEYAEGTKSYKIKLPLSGSGVDLFDQWVKYPSEEIQYKLITKCGDQAYKSWETEEEEVPAPSIDGDPVFQVMSNSPKLKVTHPELTNTLDWEVECEGKQNYSTYTTCGISGIATRVVIQADGALDQRVRKDYCLVLKPIDPEDLSFGWSAEGVNGTNAGYDDPENPIELVNQYPNGPGNILFDYQLSRKYEVHKIHSYDRCNAETGPTSPSSGGKGKTKGGKKKVEEVGLVSQGTTWIVKSVQVDASGPHAVDGPVHTLVGSVTSGEATKPLSGAYSPTAVSCTSSKTGSAGCKKLVGADLVMRKLGVTEFKLTVRDLDNRVVYPVASEATIRLPYRSDFKISSIDNDWDCDEIEKDGYEGAGGINFDLIRCRRHLGYGGLANPNIEARFKWEGGHLQTIMTIGSESHVASIEDLNSQGNPDPEGSHYYIPTPSGSMGGDGDIIADEPMSGEMIVRGGMTDTEDQIWEERTNLAENGLTVDDDSFNEACPAFSTSAPRSITILVAALGYDVNYYRNPMQEGGKNDSGIHWWAIQLEATDSDSDYQFYKLTVVGSDECEFVEGCNPNDGDNHWECTHYGQQWYGCSRACHFSPPPNASPGVSPSYSWCKSDYSCSLNCPSEGCDPYIYSGGS